MLHPALRTLNVFFSLKLQTSTLRLHCSYTDIVHIEQTQNSTRDRKKINSPSCTSITTYHYSLDFEGNAVFLSLECTND